MIKYIGCPPLQYDAAWWYMVVKDKTIPFRRLIPETSSLFMAIMCPCATDGWKKFSRSQTTTRL